MKTQTNTSEPHAASKRISTYPNPFNKILNIDIENAEGHTYLKIVDSNGKHISELVNKNLKGGVQKFNFDGSKLGNGLYFILLENNGKRFGSSVIIRN